MKKHFLWMLFILISLVALTGQADAAVLNLPGALTTIESEAFAGNTSLDQVIVGNKTGVIQSRAFADSSVKQVTLPNSLYFIADNAFEGVSGLKVNASAGSYAYAWAVKNGFIKVSEVPAEGTTKIVMPSTLKAGANLEIQVFGPENAISHSVFLTNTATKKTLRSSLSERNGILYWEGYELESGTYNVMVYTVTDQFTTLSPVRGTLTISGNKPKGRDDIQVPEKMQWDSKVLINNYDNEYLMLKRTDYNIDGNTIEDQYSCWLDEDGYIWIHRGLDNTVRVDVSFSFYENGLWSDWGSVKTIEIVNYEVNRPKLKYMNIPDNIVAGQDIEITFECEEGVERYYIGVSDDYSGGYVEDIVGSREIYTGPTTIIVPGYRTHIGRFNIYMELYDGEEWYTIQDQDVSDLLTWQSVDAA